MESKEEYTVFGPLRGQAAEQSRNLMTSRTSRVHLGILPPHDSATTTASLYVLLCKSSEEKYLTIYFFFGHVPNFGQDGRICHQTEDEL